MNRVDERTVSVGKRSTAHFVWRCGNCKRENTAKFDEHARPRPYTVEDNGQFAEMITVECRGLEFVDFDPKGVWSCKGVDSGARFSEVDLETGEWTDYDEKSACPVSIMDVQGRWTRA